MTGITLSLWDAKLLGAALVPHAAKDGITPVLTHIGIGGKLGNYAVATNRYTVGRYDLTNILHSDMPEETFMVPAKVFSALRQIGPSTLPNQIMLENYRLRIETLTVGKLEYIQAKVLWRDEDGSDTVHYMRTWLTTANPGNFPPVDRFFDEVVESADLRHTVLNARYLESFLGYAKTVGHSVRVSLIDTDSARGLNPVLVEIGHRFKGLIQPVTEDDAEFGTNLTKANAERIAAEKAEKAEAEATE